MMQPLISVIVPVYNVEIYLSTCVNSVICQTYTNWELILVDDGSYDSSPFICDDYASRDNRIKVIHKNNGGQAEARNVALDIVAGEYLMFLDADDFLHSDTLQDISHIAEKESADIVQFAFISGKRRDFPDIRKKCSIHIFDNHSIFYSSVQKVVVWGKLYQSKLWKDIRMPIGKMNYEDDATTWKLYYRSSRIVYVDIPYYYYFKNPSSTMAKQRAQINISFINAYEERISFFEKKNEKLLVDLSRWRFCLPLMLSYVKGNIKSEELPILLNLFDKNINSVICCNKVPLMHRLLFSIFRLCPNIFRSLFMLCGKAHNI